MHGFDQGGHAFRRRELGNAVAEVEDMAGIAQFTPPESVTALVETVHAHSRVLRK